MKDSNAFWSGRGPVINTKKLLAVAMGRKQLSPPTTDGEARLHEPIRLNAEIGHRNQTHRRETVAEIQMEPRRLELLTPCMPCRYFLLETY